MVDSVWKARLLPASFRGIPFLIDSHEFNGGRNNVSHETPEGERGFCEDLGKKTPGYNITGHVLGDNYFFIRDALIAAMQNGDKGFLVHPYLGLKEVQPGEFSFSETTTEGRLARFTFNFIEAGNPSFPVSLLDDITSFVTSVVATVAIVQNVFQIAYSVSQLPGYARASAKALINDFVKTVNQKIGGISGNDSGKANLKKKLLEVESSSGLLAVNPASLAAEVDNILSLVRDLPEDKTESSTIDIASGRDENIDPLLELSGYTSNLADIEKLTPTRTREKSNADAIISLIRQCAIVKLSENAVAKDFDSLDSAVLVRDQISDLIEDQIEGDVDDELFNALSSFKSKVVNAIPTGQLGSIETIELFTDVPAIVIAYDLYESPALESDIIQRNAVENPGFISGSLEVLRVG